MSRLGVPLEICIRNRQANQFGLGHGQVDELLAKLIVRETLDVPCHRLSAVGAVVVWRAKHHNGRPPPAVECVLGHRFLSISALRHGHHDLESLALVKALLLANPHHGACIGAIAAFAEGHLVHDGRAIYEPANSSHVCPIQGGVVENAAVFGFAAVKVGDGVVSLNAQGLASAVEIQTMSGLVLDLGHEDGLSFETGGSTDPIAFRKHAHNFRVCVLTDLANQCFSVSVGHPILRLNLFFAGHVSLESLQQVHFHASQKYNGDGGENRWGALRVLSATVSCRNLHSMSDRFHSLKVSEVRRETSDCVSIALDVPVDLSETFTFTQGQYLTFDQEINGESVRRSYSICSGAGEELRVAIKQVKDGRFSTWANSSLQAGDVLRTLPPNGRFFTAIEENQKKNYVGFAAGSGITPILSHIKTALAKESASQFTLFYTNKEQSSVIFKRELDDLKDRYMNRLRVFHFFTREPVDIPLYGGRMDEAKVDAVCASLLNVADVDEVFSCGPEDMIMAVKSRLTAAGLAESKIHFELFTSPTAKSAKPAIEDANASAQPTGEGGGEVFVVIDGSTHKLDYDGSKTILDAGLDAGIDLPYSCCGGVCCTCRALVTEGAGEMEVNYALEPGEVEQGFVLTCQTKPKPGSGRFVVDFDQQ